jgi:tetratricopeptide (TPR) repeat protein
MSRRERLARAAAIGARAFLACAAEGAALLALLVWDNPARVFAALALHFAAAALALKAALRRHPRASVVERDTVVLTALFLPVFGPALAWSFPRLPKEAEPINAHEMFERYETHVRPRIPEYERTLFTGDHDRDVARELDAESYYEVLRHGKTDQKRNALRRLADLGERKHLELIRRCLRDPEHEVRLYAYAELERLAHVHDARIARAGREAASRPNDPAGPRDLADAHLAYAQSGILDEGMAAYHYRAAVQHAQRALDLDDPEPDAPLIAALALGELGRHAEALAYLDQVPEAHRALGKVRIVRARLAFRRRDFPAARAEAIALAQANEPTPEWLRAMLGAAGAAAPSPPLLAPVEAAPVEPAPLESARAVPAPEEAAAAVVPAPLPEIAPKEDATKEVDPFETATELPGAAAPAAPAATDDETRTEAWPEGGGA